MTQAMAESTDLELISNRYNREDTKITLQANIFVYIMYTYLSTSVCGLFFFVEY